MRYLYLLMKVWVVFFSISLCGQVWAALVLKQVRVNPVVKDQLDLELEFNEPVKKFADKLQYQPRELLLSLPDARSELTVNPIPIERQKVRQVSVQQIEKDLQIKIALDKLVPYQIRQKDKMLIVQLGQNVQMAKAVAKEQPKKPLLLKTKPVKGETPGYINRVKSFDFRRGKDGSGQFLIYLDNSSVAVDMREGKDKIKATFHGMAISDALLHIMDVKDFATPVMRIESFRKGPDVVFELDTKGKVDYRYDQADQLFVLEVAKRQKAASTKRKYRGKPISLNFQDIPVRTVLQLIADFNKFNLVTSDSVSGNVTLRLDGVPWEQALDIILKVKGLDKRLENNVLLVAPANEIAAREEQRLSALQKASDLAPLFTEYIQVNYAKASELAKLLSSGETSLLSKRGAVSVDQRTNTLLVKDTSEVMENVTRMVEILDIPVKQVLIEARIVTINDGYDQELGIRWGASKTGGEKQTAGTLEYLAGEATSLDSRLNVNFPATGAPSLAFQIAKLSKGRILDLELSALETENKGEVIASPRIMTANQQQAVIEQGTEIPYVEAASSGATSVTFKKAVLSLTVTPQITPDNRIILDLTVTQDSQGDEVATPTGPAVAIDTQQIVTQVLVDNGETLVLGGIYQQTIRTSVSKVPLLGDIPGVGVLFRKTSNTDSKRELLVFVTPKIVTESF
ncbi:type IV pilus secretin PilQ [Dongshaea marina]|uniref:type IV pilus secretin PilQ n=1 Tax=Dongshaea marina TaxID=2047966 RepID=UPI000D3EB414|nr:type IV pilus secretin PilQ family protein [Dongshaea marina]